MRSSRLRFFFVLIIIIALLSIVWVIVASNQRVKRIEQAAGKPPQPIND
ncbi:MAG TPA: hypothetical protein VLJ68_08655 [Chitinophagaceae bacterium]|nr:hypothetical protein [Chitinophagaceae bacterium]